MHTLSRHVAAVLFSAAFLLQQTGALAPAVSANSAPAQALITEDAQRFRSGSTTPVSYSSASWDELVHNPRFDDCLMLDCIDVSYHQAEIDWQAVAASGIDAAIIRLGFRGYGDTGNLVEDSYFRENLKGACDAGLQVGVYFFTQAISTDEALEEADFVLNVLGSMQWYEVTCPVFIDIEEVETPDGMGGRLDQMHFSAAEYTEIVKAFCSVVEMGGYQAGVYANKYWLEQNLYTSEFENDYAVWLANYTNETYYQGNYSFWQYSKSGSVPGISTAVDRNVIYSRPVSYADTALTLNGIGDSAKPVLNGDGTIYYVTSDPSVATVSYNGTITAAGSGTAEIMAVSSNGTKDKLTVTVGADAAFTPAPTPVQPEFGYATLLLTEPGELEQLDFIAPPDFSLISSNTDVATVSNDGVVEAVGYGTTELILEDCNGDIITCTVVIPLTAPDLGDCNLDGLTNAGDAAEILSYAADLGSGKTLSLTSAHQTVYDYNCDGVIDAADAAGVLAYSAECGAN